MAPIASAQTEAVEPIAPDSDHLDDDGLPRERIVIVGSRSETNWLETPASISVLQKDEIQRAQQQLTLGESVGHLPGVFVQNRSNFAQDSRISIRGFGARSAFGIRGIKLIVDGLPQTLPDGQGQVDSLDLSTASRIEVLRGPAASLYGSAAGGVISVTSDVGGEQPTLNSRISFGSYGYRKYQGQGSGRVGKLSYSMGLSKTELDGYRDRSATENVLFNSKFRLDLSENESITYVLNHVDTPQANDPGGLTAEEVRDDRRQANQRNVDLKSGEAIKNTTLGVVYRKAYREHHETTVTTYLNLRDFDGRIPSNSRGEIELDRTFGGGNVKHAYTKSLLGFKNRLTIGVDADGQRDKRKQRGLDGDGNVTTLSVDETQNVTSVGAFVQDEINLAENVLLSASARYDYVHFKVSDDFTDDVTGDDSDKVDYDEWSFAGGIVWSPVAYANPFARIATSFEVPTTTSFANPEGGGLNESLDAQTATHFELGSKGILSDWLRYEVAAFYIVVKDELLPYRPMFTTFYENAKKSERIGFELALNAQLHRDLQATASYTHSDFTFDKFTDGNGNRFNGNRLPGVPKNMASLVIDYEHLCGVFATADIQYIDEREADNANSVEAKDYAVLNVRGGYERAVGAWELSGFVGINNITGQKYIDSLRINDGNMRFFEPAPRRNYYGGVGVTRLF